MITRLSAHAALIALALALHPQLATAQGRYLDELVLRDVGDGREFALASVYRYLDSRGTLWIVPGGAVVNGASIPQPLWSLLGGPWEGRYRNASVIHDYFFDQQKYYGSDAVHWVFYDAMLASGVEPTKAKLMYWAVLRFNPVRRATLRKRCPTFGNAPVACSPIDAGEPLDEVVYELVTPPFDEAELRRTAEMIERTAPPVEELERLAKEKRGF